MLQNCLHSQKSPNLLHLFCPISQKPEVVFKIIEQYCINKTKITFSRVTQLLFTLPTFIIQLIQFGTKGWQYHALRHFLNYQLLSFNYFLSFYCSSFTECGRHQINYFTVRYCTCIVLYCTLLYREWSVIPATNEASVPTFLSKGRPMLINLANSIS